MHVVDYATVLTHAAADGLRCVYPNSGAFVPVGANEIVGWIGPDDPTIRPDLPARIVRCPAPYPANLAKKLVDVWQREIMSPAWLLPKSHWAYELDHAHQDWLLEILSEFRIDTAALATRTDAAALQFELGEGNHLARLLETLLNHLKTSDYAILFPGHGHAVTLHHHQQLWWQTPDTAFAEQLGRVDWAESI